MRGVIRKGIIALVGIVTLALAGFAVLAYSCHTIDQNTGQEWDGLGRELKQASFLWGEKSVGWLWSVGDCAVFLVGISIIGGLMACYAKFYDPPPLKTRPVAKNSNSTA
jgi:hypothetical protein